MNYWPLPYNDAAPLRMTVVMQYRASLYYKLQRLKTLLAETPVIGRLLFFSHPYKGVYTFRPIHVWRWVWYEWCCYKYDKSTRPKIPCW